MTVASSQVAKSPGDDWKDQEGVGVRGFRLRHSATARHAVGDWAGGFRWDCAVGKDSVRLADSASDATRVMGS